ncbi:hypothetical protein KEM55_007235, partial [Ascosphaera atra]
RANEGGSTQQLAPAPAPAPLPSVSAPSEEGDEFIESVATAATEESIVAALRSPSVEVVGASPVAPRIGPAARLEKKKKGQQKLPIEPVPHMMVS